MQQVSFYPMFSSRSLLFKLAFPVRSITKCPLNLLLNIFRNGEYVFIFPLSLLTCNVVSHLYYTTRPHLAPIPHPLLIPFSRPRPTIPHKFPMLPASTSHPYHTHSSSHSADTALPSPSKSPYTVAATTPPFPKRLAYLLVRTAPPSVLKAHPHQLSPPLRDLRSKDHVSVMTAEPSNTDIPPKDPPSRQPLPIHQVWMPNISSVAMAPPSGMDFEG